MHLARKRHVGCSHTDAPFRRTGVTFLGRCFVRTPSTTASLLRLRARAMSVLFLRPLLLHQQHLAACCGSVASTRRLAGALANSAQQPADAPSTSASAAVPSPVELKLRRSAKVHAVMPCNLMQPCSTQPCFNPVTITLPASADTKSCARRHSSLFQPLNSTALVLRVPFSAWMSSSAMAAPSASLQSS